MLCNPWHKTHKQKSQDRVLSKRPISQTRKSKIVFLIMEAHAMTCFHFAVQPLIAAQQSLLSLPLRFVLVVHVPLCLIIVLRMVALEMSCRCCLDPLECGKKELDILQRILPAWFGTSLLVTLRAAETIVSLPRARPEFLSLCESLRPPSCSDSGRKQAPREPIKQHLLTDSLVPYHD